MSRRGYWVVVCSVGSLSQWQGWLLPCPIKVVTGVDCPGCGFQRSLLALLQGRWNESYQLYPPTVPLILLLLYILLKNACGFDKRSVVLKLLAIACGWFILGVYVMKLWHGHQL